MQVLINLIKNLVSHFLKSSKSLEDVQNVNPAAVVKENKVAITLEAFFTELKSGEDRRIKYKDEYTLELESSAIALLEKVNAFMLDLGIMSCRVSSGWRPPSVNSTVGGAKRSLHVRCMAIDIVDSTGELKRLIREKEEWLIANGREPLLKKYGLWMEDESATPTWAHLDCGERRERPLRIFKP